MNRAVDIRLWAEDRNLIEGSNPAAQSLKLIEEIGEACGAIARMPAAEATGDEHKVRDLRAKAMDGIGDAFVVLTIMAAQLNARIEDCIELAWHEIRDRKGRMVDGVFVKEADL